MKITNGNIYLPDYQFHAGTLEIRNNRIADSCNPIMADEEILDATGCYVIPGLIDLHFHGCNGADFCDGTADAIQKITAYEAAQGITGICPASMTLPEAELSRIMANAAAYSCPQLHADLLGVRLEGPFLSAAKCGAQNPAFLHEPDITFFHRLQEQAQGLIRIIDVAPEKDIHSDFIREISKACIVSLAHTTADYATCMDAFAAGASQVTHLFNAMNGFNHRAPGLIGAAYDSPACNVELICDGIHVAPAAIRMTFQLYTDARIILISDSMRAAGMPDGEYSLGGQRVNVQGNRATLENGTIAGSVTNLMDCVRRAVSFGIPLESALRCATANPAHVLGVDDRYGYLKPGYIANVVILNPDLSLRKVILRGQLLF